MQSFAHTFAQTSGINATQKYNTKTTSSLQPKTTTNNILNPKDASNIHSLHHHYHIGFPHH